MSKQIEYAEEARNKILSGVKKLSQAVKVTLGPKGRNVIIGRKFASPLITNDGVTIAKEVELDDPIENIGADIIKEVSIKTNELAGDGTTTAVVLAEALISEGVKNVVAGANPIELKKGIKKATDFVTTFLTQISKPIESKEEISQVGTISAGDNTIGDLIANAMEAVGRDGAITLEEGTGTSTELKIVEGFQFDRGYLSPYMSTDMNKMVAELDNPLILMTDKKISNLNELLPIIEPIAKDGRKLLIIADEIESDALATLVLNKIKGTLNCVAVKSPAFGDRRKDLMQDIAIQTGATIVSSETGMNFSNVGLDVLGGAKKIVVDSASTTIIEGLGNKSEIENRKNQIREQIKTLETEYEKEKMSERLAKLSGGVAVIKVGSATEFEMKEKKLRIEDALSATKSATIDGIVAGGGVALLSAYEDLKNFIQDLDGDIKTGAEIVLNALSAPLKQIVANCGKDAGIIASQCLELSKSNCGYDAQNDKFGNMFEFGIIDPTKVTKEAIINAGSVAGTLLTTECIIADTTKEESH